MKTEIAVTGKHTFQDLPMGWRWRETPGHGYLHPSREAQEKVPQFLRHHYPYEEDCAYVIPVVCNSTLFTAETVDKAMRTFADWYPEEFEIVFQTTLERGKSYLKDQTFERLDNIGQFEKTCGSGDWRYGVPRGFVLAVGRQVTENDCKNHKVKRSSGREIEGLIPNKVYDSKQFFAESDFLPLVPGYDMNEFHTWEDYTKRTGKERTI